MLNKALALVSVGWWKVLSSFLLRTESIRKAKQLFREKKMENKLFSVHTVGLLWIEKKNIVQSTHSTTTEHEESTEARQTWIERIY